MDRMGLVQPRIPVNGAMFPGMPMGYDKFGGLVYDYNLPDRGLGTSALAALQPRFPAVSPNMVGYFPLPVGAWNLPGTPAIHGVVSPGIAMDTSGPGAPLDLSASHKESSEKEKSGGKSSPASASTSTGKNQNQKSTKQAKEEKEKASGSEAATEAKSKPEENARRPKYSKNMLIFGDKEVEIISVEKNRWIVRNEQELFEIIRSISPEPRSQTSKVSHLTPCDSASGSDCECLRTSLCREEDMNGGSGHPTASKDDCACVTSSMKRAGSDPSHVPSSSTQKDCSAGSESPESGVGKLKTKATSSTGQSADSGEEEACDPSASSPSAMNMESCNKTVETGKHKGSPVGEVVDLVCEEDTTTTSKCPVLQQMLKTSQ